jgi:hypothetical protein
MSIVIDLSHHDSRDETSEVIYEAYRRRQLEGKIRSRLVIFLATFMACGAVFCIAILQYDEYLALQNDRLDYINSTEILCNLTSLANIDIISTPIAAFLILTYILIYKRRVFWRDKFHYRNIGLPMIVSCWNKTNRLYSSFVYGLIAFNVFNIAKNYLNNNRNSENLVHNVNDPTGLLSLLVKVCEMILIGIRYYPVLVGEYMVFNLKPYCMDSFG